MKLLGTLVPVEDIHAHLAQHELAVEERAELLAIMEDALFHRFLDVVLTDLSREDRVFVLENLAGEDHTVIIEFVRERKPDVHLTLQQELDRAKQELLAELTAESKE